MWEILIRFIGAAIALFVLACGLALAVQRWIWSKER